jgi:uncharacterized protein YndB with AHSA1/START domain
VTTRTLSITTPTDREIVMTRAFDAPRPLVFEAYTRPDLLKRWLTGPPGWSLDVCDIDLKVGGAFRYVWRQAGRTDIGMGGVFREVRRPERLVTTEVFDPSWYPGTALNTLELAEEGGGTMLTLTVLYESREARDIALKSSLDGMETSFEKLADVLAEMK